jgi:hypothetical protein
VDGLLLVSNKYAQEKKVIFEDSSPESTARIRLEFERGQLRKVQPKSAILFLGGS